MAVISFGAQEVQSVLPLAHPRNVFAPTPTTVLDLSNRNPTVTHNKKWANCSCFFDSLIKLTLVGFYLFKVILYYMNVQRLELIE